MLEIPLILRLLNGIAAILCFRVVVKNVKVMEYLKQQQKKDLPE